ncbi:MAG TPA: dihydrolipoamide acetyltransferase family protein [Anaerolineae bacterium]|nr:dihydrolipoamide acetyltransferase family protein [Anaerolineae bacterium]
MYEFKLPDVGEGIHEAEILKWLVKDGETVSQDQPILEIQTDKAVVELPSPVAGTIAEIRADAGSMAHVGDVLVVIKTAKEQTIPGPAQNSATTSPRLELGQKVENASHAIKGPGGRPLAAPVVRKLALELGVDLTQVPGSGPAGRVLPEDVHRFVKQSANNKPSAPPVRPDTISTPADEPLQAPAPLSQPGASPRELVEEEALQGLRRRIAERMELAWRIPHVTSFEEIDATNLVTLRRQLQAEVERRGSRLTYLPFIIKATTQLLKEFPYFNATLDMESKKILLHRYYHLGIATAVPEGLLVPVIRHADQMNLLQLAAELNRLGELAQQRKLSQAELSGSTFTITNFGSFGAHQGTPIINPPEVAILGCGRIEEKPVAVQGQVEVRPVLPLALSYDHRLIDGAAAGAFLGRLKTLLADPNLLFLELV